MLWRCCVIIDQLSAHLIQPEGSDVGFEPRILLLLCLSTPMLACIISFHWIDPLCLIMSIKSCLASALSLQRGLKLISSHASAWHRSITSTWLTHMQYWASTECSNIANHLLYPTCSQESLPCPELKNTVWVGFPPCSCQCKKSRDRQGRRVHLDWHEIRSLWFVIQTETWKDAHWAQQNVPYGAQILSICQISWRI